MNKTLIALTAATALLLTGLVAPALADGNETGPRGGHEAADERRAQREEARAQYHDEKREARENFTDQMRKSGKAHRECAQQHRGDNNTTDNATEEAIRACHEQVREGLHQLRLDARTHFQEAKRLAQSKYQDALRASRAAYLDDRSDDDDCAENTTCVAKHIERLEAQKARAQERYDALAERKAELETQLANTTDNETAFETQDALYGVQIRMLKLERLIFRIDGRIADWEEHLAQPESGGDGGSGNTTGNETA